MTHELLGWGLLASKALLPWLLVLFVGGLIADYIFPHIKFINRFIDSLPLSQKEIQIERSKECEKTTNL